MISKSADSLSDKARQLYKSTLCEQLERDSFGKYVAIEPESGDHFVGGSFDEAVNAAIDQYPDRRTFTIRIGHTAALHLGTLTR